MTTIMWSFGDLYNNNIFHGFSKHMNLVLFIVI